MEIHPHGSPTERERPADRMRSEHMGLEAIAARVEALLARLAADAASRAEASRAEALLSELRRRLRAHLDREERDRILERAAAVEPRLQPGAERLLAEHAELRDRADRLVASVRVWGWVEVQRRFATFREGLTAHERAENDLLHAAYLEDLGGRG